MVVAGAISAPNIFTPNLDGLNDVLEFPNLDFFPSNHLMVWNRWGNLVLDRENYKNNWDGGDLPGGTYYYILDVELLGEQSGYIFIVR
jgi:gliding motility-associated-like protein